MTGKYYGNIVSLPSSALALIVSFVFKAFSSFDFKGKGYLEASDIADDKISYKLPLTKEVSLFKISDYPKGI